MTVAALIVAAGRGTRAGGGLPKQYRPLLGAPVLSHAVDCFARHPAVGLIQVVIHPNDADRSAQALEGRDCLPPVSGRATRAASVRAGLEALRPHDPSVVLIHDAARPGLPGGVIDRLLAALDTHPGAVPALPVVDALWRTDAGQADAPIARDGLVRAQTPQAFRFADIWQAHQDGPEDAADDVALARRLGIPVAVVQGDEKALKITHADDFARAAQALGGPDVRTGNGFDVHAFGPGDHVTLCGVRIEHDRGLVGHSDADVAMHTLTDAIFGALADGDIGQWFPPTDPQWKGAASEIFLAKAVHRATEGGYALTHADITIICERPKIGPHAAAMRAELARITGVDAGRLSVKATTSERLGFTGRGEGIAAMATATLVRG